MKLPARTAKTLPTVALAVLILAVTACAGDGGSAGDADVTTTTSDSTTTSATGGTGGVPAPDVPVPANPLWTGDTKPSPVPPENVVLSLPRDMYRHEGAPTEWWWHIGTLRAGDLVFGFEINAASFVGQGFAMT